MSSHEWAAIGYESQTQSALVTKLIFTVFFFFLICNETIYLILGWNSLSQHQGSSGKNIYIA